MDADFILVQRMRRGDDAAFELFINKYYTDILRYCLYHCFDREEAKDLAQETFLEFFKHFREYIHQGKAKNYLYVIASGKCKDLFRKGKELPLDPEELALRMERAEGGGREAAGFDPEKLATRITVREGLLSLPEEFREVIVLRYYQELKLSEIAEILGIGLPLVKYRLKRGKALLDQELRDGGMMG